MAQIPTTASALSMEATSLLERLQQAAAASNADEQAYVLKLLSQHYSRTCQWDLAEETAKQGIAVAQKATNRQRLGDALNRLGAVLLDTKSASAAEPITEALGVYREIGDHAGQARCHINLGIIHLKDGRSAQAVNEFQTASKAAKQAGADDLVGLAEMNTGVLLLETSQFAAAVQPFDAALLAATKIGDKRLTVMTRFNQAHVARELGEHTKAIAIYTETIRLAAEIGMLDIELGAHAGRGLSAIANKDLPAAQADQNAIDAKLTGRREWAFQGRELVEALFVRIALATKEVEKAIVRLTDALPKQRDASSVTWLMAECAPQLLKSGGFLPISLLKQAMQPVAQGKRISTPAVQAPRVSV